MGWPEISFLFADIRWELPMNEEPDWRGLQPTGADSATRSRSPGNSSGVSGLAKKVGMRVRVLVKRVSARPDWYLESLALRLGRSIRPSFGANEPSFER